MFDDKCKLPIPLAYAMLTYIIGSIYYVIFTINISTPFKDSLNEEQKKIKSESSKVRRQIFYQGLGVGIIMIIFINPFEKC
jgi:cell division protein FtsW (lipid II flippase)|tara:strand:- start:138 stop:380 length:243 start_codon:yes stop_codon:yes gene_type:complete